MLNNLEFMSVIMDDFNRNSELSNNLAVISHLTNDIGLESQIDANAEIMSQIANNKKNLSIFTNELKIISE
jgi:hypothetical protein